MFLNSTPYILQLNIIACVRLADFKSLVKSQIANIMFRDTYHEMTEETMTTVMNNSVYLYCLCLSVYWFFSSFCSSQALRDLNAQYARKITIIKLGKRNTPSYMSVQITYPFHAWSHKVYQELHLFTRATFSAIHMWIILSESLYLFYMLSLFYCLQDS